MSDKSAPNPMLDEPGQSIDPLGDVEEAAVKNRARVGSARPSSLMYTYGPGAVMDLPGISVMPAGLNDWEPIWRRREFVPRYVEPRLLDVVRLHLGPQVNELRPYPWQPKSNSLSKEGGDLGIPARVFPQWYRCTGCDLLAPLPLFTYTNTHPFRPDLASISHEKCPGRRRGKASGGSRSSRAVPARHLLTCSGGHLDEFPYDLWVHRGKACPKVPQPTLKMQDAYLGNSVGARITCTSCDAVRGMAEAQGAVGSEKLPQECRGRHPHLGAFDKNCEEKPALIMMGASNLWFAATQSVIVMPRTDQESLEAIGQRLQAEVGMEKIEEFGSDVKFIRALADGKVDLEGIADSDLAAIISDLLAPDPSGDEQGEQLAAWDPVELLVPEWAYLQKPSLFAHQSSDSDLMVTEKTGFGPSLPEGIERVVAVDRLKKVNAFMGFTRLDELDRVSDRASRLVKLTRNGRPEWVPATEDLGEGIFLQLNADRVDAWEASVTESAVWEAHWEAHRRNFNRRFSATSADVDPDTRLPVPRYWLLHTLSHVLIREMAMSCGYGAASLTERIYGWPASDERESAAGILICTTAADSDGTLGGLVALAEPGRFEYVVAKALRRAGRCSSDPVCAQRTPSDPEDFLHGAACHSCTFASETSCEKSNRFLDRRFLLTLPSADGAAVEGFFGTPDVI
jgi:hypothetical protein